MKLKLMIMTGLILASAYSIAGGGRGGDPDVQCQNLIKKYQNALNEEHKKFLDYVFAKGTTNAILNELKARGCKIPAIKLEPEVKAVGTLSPTDQNVLKQREDEVKQKADKINKGTYARKAASSDAESRKKTSSRAGDFYEQHYPVGT